MTRIRVAPEDAFDKTGRILVDVNDVEIGVFNIGEEYYAVLNNCPHQNGPLAEGSIQRSITAEVPENGEWIKEEYDNESKVIRCPLHGWGFDVDTGENIADRENAPMVPTYDVVVEGDDVFIEL